MSNDLNIVTAKLAYAFCQFLTKKKLKQKQETR